MVAVLAGSYDTLLSSLLPNIFQISTNVVLPSKFVMLMPTVRILVDHIFALVKLDTVEMEKNAQVGSA